MTNLEYIQKHTTEEDVICAMNVLCWNTQFTDDSIFCRAYYAWRKWAESASPNKGNQAKGCISSKFGKVVEHDPSVWMYEHWFYPDYSFRNSGRNRYVSYSVWLSEQYNPKEWEDEDI